MKLGALFKPKPASWGYRGDPYLWEALRLRFAEASIPQTEPELIAVLEAAFRDETGFPIDHGDDIHVARWSHGGMSSGMICRDFWRSRGIPLLRRRWRKAISKQAEVR